MSIVYHVDKDKGIVYVFWRGSIKAIDFIEHVRRMTSDQDWRSSAKLQIADLRHAAADDSIDNDVLEEAGAYYGKYLDRMSMLRVAIVTTTELEKTNFFAGFMSHYDTATARVFHTMEEAVEWLGIDRAATAAVFKKLELMIQAD